MMRGNEEKKAKFDELFKEWKNIIQDPKIKLSSRPQDYINNEPYQKIVEMGRNILPFIVEKLEQGAFFFNQAFIEITQINMDEFINNEKPFPSEQEKSRLLLNWWKNQQSNAMRAHSTIDISHTLPDCFSKYLGRWIVSPRNEIFNTDSQKYLLTRMSDERQYAEIRFESGTSLRLHYWRFNLVADIISQAKGEYTMIGSRINPDDQTTIEGRLVKEALEKGHKYAKLRTAAFVCDMIVLCGYAQYGYMINPKTDRKVQGIKSINLRTLEQS